MDNRRIVGKALRWTLGPMASYGRYLFYAQKALRKQAKRPNTFAKLVRLLRQEGLKGIVRRVRIVIDTKALSPESKIVFDDYKDPYLEYKIIPFYVDQKLDAVAGLIADDLSICIHFHVWTPAIPSSLFARLSRIPSAFDLYITAPHGTQEELLRSQLEELVPRAKKTFIEKTSDHVQIHGLVAMVGAFGASIGKYAIVGHFSCAELPEGTIQEQLGNDKALDHLLGPTDGCGGRIAFFLRELQTRAKLIIAEKDLHTKPDPEHDRITRGIVSDLTRHRHGFALEDFPELDWAEKGMFWARTECIKDLLAIPMVLDGEPERMHCKASQLNKALSCALLLFSIPHQGKILRIIKGDSLRDYRYFESQKDYRGLIVHDDIKVLSYYLPQFHPIPENDQWHGQGFTEWTNVSSSTPLFQGHYQQHIPHPDIGYYKLESPEMLQHQAGMMQKAGVYGQIFYHYWFSGKLILEEPARMLLANPDIPMPFCFCWANENWTRRWDGNANDILLVQSYSKNDAIAFVKYLLPFFKDDRYIKVDQRPVLFIYRPSCIANIAAYLDAWRTECQAVGLAAPYLVAVLTRGATSPVEFGMDAGAERVLHDWTQGAVQEINHGLTTYEDIEGSILPYKDVSKYYMDRNESMIFDYFQSIVPMWDNSSRYGKSAHIVHGSTPELFQIWLEKLITQSSQRLPSDRRFILVNAWNEWSEGAHLEPDSQYGYGYLNSVGRALSGLPYANTKDSHSSCLASLRIHILFGQELLDQLNKDPGLARRCFFGLFQSRLSPNMFVSPEQQLGDKQEGVFKLGCIDDADLVVEFRRAAVFSSQLLEMLVEKVLSNDESVVIPNAYGLDEALIIPASNGAVQDIQANKSPVVLYSRCGRDLRRPRVIMQTNALCFLTQPNTRLGFDLPVVTVIMRIHKDGDLGLLENALGCLVAMQDCICLPLIAAQDLTAEQLDLLSLIVNRFPWYKHYPPRIDCYTSSPGRADLRSKMLNESLQGISTKYVAFLDYDDLLMPFAYSLLLGKIRATGRAIAFARVYQSSYDTRRRLIIGRAKTFEYGCSYGDFLGQNCIPLHSFVMDAEAIHLDQIVWRDDQKFMEDYFLTLQIFAEDNADWLGLRDNIYIGDYLHSTDRSHTLAILDEKKRDALHRDKEYLCCLRHVQNMQVKQKEAFSSRNGIMS